MFNFIGAAIAAGVIAGGTAYGAPAAPLAVAQEYVMGTLGEVRIYALTDPAGARAAADAAMAEIRTLDRLLAVQRPASDVSRLNRDGHAGPVPVDARVIEVLQASLALSRLTGGAFDVTVLPVVQAWGFTDGRPHRPAGGRRPRIAGFQAVQVDAVARTVAFTDAAAGVDLGGIGKGYALDRAREVLRAHGVDSAWLDLGGQIATIGRPLDAPRWLVGVRDPRHPGRLLGRVAIDEASVSTSSDEQQFVEHDGVRSGHVFDPRTGEPATGLVSATVIAPSAATADALSTAALVLGRTRTAAVLAQHHFDHVLVQTADDGALETQASTGATFEPVSHSPTAGAPGRRHRSRS